MPETSVLSLNERSANTGAVASARGDMHRSQEKGEIFPSLSLLSWWQKELTDLGNDGTLACGFIYSRSAFVVVRKISCDCPIFLAIIDL